ncbi:MAG: hypothetical protein AAFO72_02445 [Pseudomonadota bacterium]
MKCVLHIGTEKTGTTLLQNWLYENEQALSAQGVALSQIMDAPNNRKFVAYVHGGIDDYLKSKSIFTKDERDAFFDGYAEQLADAFTRASKTHSTFLITSEHFHSRLISRKQVKRVEETLSPFFEDFRVVCYFREQSRKRTSLYSTGLRSGGGVALETFQKDKSPDNHQYNYLTSFRKWEDAFGMKALVPRIYDRDLLDDGDIRRDFLNHALPEVDAAAFSYDTQEANTSLSHDEARLLQAVNSARSKRIGRVQDPLPGVLNKLVSDLPGLDRSAKIHDPRQPEMYAAFDASNRAFFKRYFGHDGNLFKAPQSVAAHPDDVPTYRLSDLVDLVQGVASQRNLVVVTESEVNVMKNVASRLYASGEISAVEAIALFSVAQRVRRADKGIAEQIDKLWLEKRAGSKAQT